jgi:hypothetical protein
LQRKAIKSSMGGEVPRDRTAMSIHGLHSLNFNFHGTYIYISAKKELTCGVEYYRCPFYSWDRLKLSCFVKENKRMVRICEFDKYVIYRLLN